MVQNLLEFHCRNTVNKSRYVSLNKEQISFTLILTRPHCILKYKVKLEKWQKPPPQTNQQKKKTKNQTKKKQMYFEVENSKHSNIVKQQPLHLPVYLSACAQPSASALTSLCLFQSKTSKETGFLLEQSEAAPCSLFSVSNPTHRHENFSGCAPGTYRTSQSFLVLPQYHDVWNPLSLSLK